MTTLRIEHEVSDFDTWRAAFQRDPLQRKASGVRSFVVQRPVGESDVVLIDMVFDDVPSAEHMLERLREFWQTPAAAPAFAGSLRTRIVETAAAEHIA
ncbi:MAG: hypothetical protein ABIM89_10425 [Mycobacteriales bacterium]